MSSIAFLAACHICTYLYKCITFFVLANKICLIDCLSYVYYGRTLSDASMLYFADVFFIFFMAALVGQTAERIFTKLSHVVDIRCYLRTY